MLTSITQNMYLSLRKNEGKLKRDLQRMKDSYPQFFADYLPDEDILTFFEGKLFPEAFTRTFYVSNTSLKDQFVDVTIRPKIQGPLLEAIFPAGMSVAIRGHFSPPFNPVFIVDRITDIMDSDQREFEKEVTAQIFAEEKNVYQAKRENNVFSLEFVSTLPEISKETASNLEVWNDYLEWKNQIVRNKQDGVKFVHADIEDEQLFFTVIFENQSHVGKYKRYLRRDQIMIFPNSYSKHPWSFRLNEEKFIRGQEIGDFVDLKEVTEIKGSTLFHIQDMLDDLGCDWENPFVAKAIFKLTDDDQNQLLNAPVEESHFLLAEILEEYPKNGFLSASSAGEFSLIRRQKQVLNQLQLESGYAPFLSSWLFDIANANKVDTVNRIDNFNRDDLNTDQQKAVEKMVNAPDVFLLQGPPGTGKTTVIAEAIYQFAKQGKKVILASQANLAVDNVLERLAASPDIRAIRLGREGKLSEEGKQFSEKRVLKGFYSSISNDIHSRFLNRWYERDEMIATLNELQEETKLVQHDVDKIREHLQKQKQQVDNIQLLMRKESQKLEKAREEAAKHQETKEHVIKLKQYISEQIDTNFTIPDMLLKSIYQSIVKPAEILARHHIVLNEFWPENNNLSDIDKTKAFKIFWNRWIRLQQFLPTIAADTKRLVGQSSGYDVDVMLQMQELEKKIKQVELEMEEDVSKVVLWKTYRGQLKELKNNRTTALDEEYHQIFNGTHQGQPYINTLQEKLQKDAVALSHELQNVYNDALVLEQLLEQAQKQLLLDAEAFDVSNENTSIDETLYHKIRATLQREQQAYQEVYQRYESKTEMLSTLFASIKRLLEQDVEDEEVTDVLEEKLTSLEDSSVLDKQFEADWKPLFVEWNEMLQDPSTAKNDYEHYMGTYMDACNVVGVTCTENTKLLEQNNHTNFDVAIIDEVSKATPPELLMPMIRAKKSILVGDHRQLPPLFKEHENSYEELIKQLKEEQDELPPEDQSYDDELLNVENFERFKSMVTASLFKDYFELADPSIKEALLTQYRMHPDIMGVINQFYENKLTCGLNNPDAQRSHGLVVSSPEGLDFITPNRHAIWVDTSKNPRGEVTYEEQVGTSKINTLECILIAETLRKIDEQYTKQGVTEKKDIGVISFYGKQVTEIRKRVRQMKFQSINVDINTVDKFQGKEKSIILVSLVRNKNTRKKAQNSFVAAFERINVAFSRAKELLVVFGAKDMFYDYDVELPNMDTKGSTTKRVYRDIMDRLQLNACFWETRRILTPEQYTELLPNKEERTNKKLQPIER